MNDLQPRQPQQSLQNWNGFRGMAETFLKSGLAPTSIRTPEQAMIIAAAGSELGVPFMASMRSINVIQNRPTASVQLKLALAMNTGELEDFTIERRQDEVIATIKRKGRTLVSLPFGKKEAMAMKLIGKDNYDKQPMTMYQWRALGAALDIAFADVLLGMHSDHGTADIPALLDSQFVEPSQTIIPAPTALQETIYAHESHVEEQKQTESASNSEEVTDLVKDIQEMLAEMNEGNEDSMEIQLKKLTTYKDKNGKEKYVELNRLEAIQAARPLWIVTIHKKVKEVFEQFQAEPKQESLGI